ncbi:MAG: polysaccharide deacetylase [Oscillospiraceae bacterium]|nr:polysaccharide deacetylase [Oscillospiraceae bacterium]
MPVEQPRPIRRRRRRRRPRWQRVLRRYWPPIRFGLICLALLVLLIYTGKLVVTLLSGEIRRDDTTYTSEPVQTDPPLDQLQAEVDALIKQADFIAAGYDYAGATQMLKTYAYYDQFADQLDAKADEYATLDAQLVSYDKMDQITHVFFHSLIVDTDRCFDGDYREQGYNLYMTTVDEFLAMMESMYERGYVLVSPYDVAYEVTDENGTHFTYGDIRLPEGKIPFVMSQDDVNYYGYMIGDEDPELNRPSVANANGDGFAHKLIIGEDGYPTCEYYDAAGNLLVGDYDLVPILETFIQAHPDFSYHGARAVLGMTGYEGVFGYRTKPGHAEYMSAEAYQAEVDAAKEVAQCLRDHGWILASHTYGHPSLGNISVDKVASDTQKWEDTVESIIGDCDIILYPNGSDIAGVEKYTMDNEKFQILYDSGIRYFYNVDSHVHWCQLGSNYFRGGRRNLDGYRMYNNPDKLDDLFDAVAIFDPARPTPVEF